MTTDQDKVIAALLDVVGDLLGDRDIHFAAKTLMPVVEELKRQAAAEALMLAFVEDRTTVAKMTAIEQLTCFVVKTEDLLARATELDPS